MSLWRILISCLLFLAPENNLWVKSLSEFDLANIFIEIVQFDGLFYFKYGTKSSYGCNAGLVRLSLEATNGKDVLLFSTPDNPGSTRVRMTVWASFDGAKTWLVKRLVYESPSAYSSLAAGQDGNIYLLFERRKKKLYESVAVARFNLKWLTKEQDWRTLSKN